MAVILVVSEQSKGTYVPAGTSGSYFAARFVLVTSEEALILMART